MSIPLDIKWGVPQGAYVIGQYVYLTKEIRGWFDYSTKLSIPVGASGTVTGYRWMARDVNKMIYEVDFGKEFGVQILSHSSLKLG